MTTPKTLGVIGCFLEPQDALAAAAKTRDAGWKHFDFLTPFPVHGIEALGVSARQPHEAHGPNPEPRLFDPLDDAACKTARHRVSSRCGAGSSSARKRATTRPCKPRRARWSARCRSSWGRPRTS